MSFFYRQLPGRNTDMTKANHPREMDWDKDFAKTIEEMMNGFSPKAFENSLKGFAPAMNIKEESDRYIIDAELPGVQKQNVDINIKDDHLIIRGEKNSRDEEDSEKYHRIERTHGSFYRTIQLPSDFDKERVHAELVDGVLKVEIGKCQKAVSEHRKVEIR